MFKFNRKGGKNNVYRKTNPKLRVKIQNSGYA